MTLLEEVVEEFIPPAPFAGTVAQLRPQLGTLESLAVCQPVRDEFERAITKMMFAQRQPPEAIYDEIVIGGGMSAAAYCAMRNRPNALVLESTPKLGGIFAIAERPVFYLNSRNRPSTEAPESGPGTRAPLNYIPYGILQPSDVDAREYQSQDVLGFIATVNLAHYASRVINDKVNSITKDPSGVFYYAVANRGYYAAKRIVIATGLGVDDVDSIDVDVQAGPVFTFTSFLRLMGSTNNFRPLEGWERVAVVGAGDSGNVVVEYLLGQGPDTGYSCASRDSVRHITWIGQSCTTREQFQRRARSRYAGIARFISRNEGQRIPPRISAVPGKATRVLPAPNGKILLRWRNQVGKSCADVFDKVVLCTGFKTSYPKLVDLPRPSVMSVDGQQVAKKVPDEEIYFIGPCADLEVSNQEKINNPALERIPNNSAALFRYMDKTAVVATRT